MLMEKNSFVCSVFSLSSIRAKQTAIESMASTVYKMYVSLSVAITAVHTKITVL